MKVELAYLAGVLDGDGAIMLRPFSGKTSTYLLTVMVGSCCEAQVRFFEHLFGGCVRQCRHERLNKNGRRTIYYEWRVTQAKAGAVLQVLRPHLRLRAAHADVGLAYRLRVGKRGQVVSAGEARARSALREQMVTLNARGVAVPLRRLGVPTPFEFEAEELAYLAGLFDAEGTITWVNDRERITPLLHVGVVNTTDTACWLFALRFGGRVNEVHRAGRGIFSWYLRQRKALLVLQALLPYLREKRAAAEVALQRGIRPARRATVLPFVQKEGA